MSCRGCGADNLGYHLCPNSHRQLCLDCCDCPDHAEPARDVPALGFNVEIGGHVVKVTDTWVVAVVPMIFNDRVILCRVDEWRTGITAGFCYDKGAAAAIAAQMWDPHVDADPLGFKKRAFDARRAEELP